MARFSQFRALHKKLGTPRLAQKLGVSESTVRRQLRAQKLSPQVSKKASKIVNYYKGAAKRKKERKYVAAEREAIQAETLRTVPGYSQRKLDEVVLPWMRKFIGESSVRHQEIRHTIKVLNRSNLAVPEQLTSEMEELARRNAIALRIERAIRPSDTIEDRLYRVENIDKEYASIARQYGMTARAVYSLYYSPPSLGTS